MVGHINGEVEVASTVEASILSIDIDPRLIVDGTKIEMGSFTSPVRGDIE